MSEYHECHECGMMVASGAYHPYAACLMFRACHDGEVVRANLEGVMAHGIQYHSEEIPLRERIASLEAEVERLRKDAERYRWLRKCHWNSAPLAVVVRPKDAVKLGHDCPSEGRLDSAIDAALSQPSDQQGGEG